MRKKRSVRRALKRERLAPPLRNGINASEIILPRVDAHGAPLPFATLGEWAEAGWGVQAREAFATKAYLADYNKVLCADAPYQPGQRIWVFRPVLDEPKEPIQLSVVAENERYLVVEKPHGMATIPRGSHVANTVTVAARRQFGNDQLVCAHRLDLETAGLVLLTKAAKYRAPYQLVFQRRAIEKSYLAAAPLSSQFADGKVQQLHLPLYRPRGQIGMEVLSTAGAFAAGADCEQNTGVAAGKNLGAESAVAQNTGAKFIENGEKIWQSHTAVQLVAQVSRQEIAQTPQLLQTSQALFPQTAEAGSTQGRSDHGGDYVGDHGGDHGDGSGQYANLPSQWGIYRLWPRTGYLHQLRVTMQHLGLPIFGDPLYPVRLSKAAEERRDFPLQLLAQELQFIDPVSGAEVNLRSTQHLALETALESG